MPKVKYLPNKLTKLLSLVMFLNLVLLSFANSASAERRQEKTKMSNFGLPTHRRDGGSRADKCIADAENQNLMALIPQENVGANASASPELFFYIPEVKSQRTLEFVMRNEEDRLMYEAFFTTEGNGIVSVEVPADVAANMLKTDENYHWYLSMICDPEQRSRDLVVEGWMRQETIDPATQQELETASLLEKAEVYRDRGFWFDALSVLTEDSGALQEQSMARQKWSEMLDSVGLKELTSKPFVEAQLIDRPAK